MKKKSKNPTLLIFLMFATIGVILFGIGIALFVSDKNFKSTAKETEAKITDIYTSRDSDGDTSHTVYVSYSIKGQEYSGRLNYYTSGMREGQNVTIYYDPANPGDFRGGGAAVALYILGIMGIVFFIVGFIGLRSQIKRKAMKKRMLTTGTKIYATMTDVVPGNVSVNGRPCMHIICEYKNESTGTLYIFKSDGVWASIPHMTTGASRVPVYVDYNDYTKYYVDVDSYLEELAGVSQVVDLT